MRISDWSSDGCSSDLNEFGLGYERVNEQFANILYPLIEEEDIVWVQDYHFLPLGERLRAHGVRNRIGLFLHIPWPPTRLFVSLPHHERLVAAMLHYDVIGLDRKSTRLNSSH